MNDALKLFRLYRMGLISLTEYENELKELGTDYDTVLELYNSTRRV